MGICRKSVKDYKEISARTERCVCKYCGGELELRQIFAGAMHTGRTEIFCKDCNRIEYGVEPEIYQTAKYFVNNFSFNCFYEIEDMQQLLRMNVAKVAEIMTWTMQSFGLLDAMGFVESVKDEVKKSGNLLEPDEILEEC